MNKETFCSAPWTQIRIDWDGKFRPCCVIQPDASEFTGKKNYSIHDSSLDEFMTSDYLQYLRQSLGSGVPVAECQSCWAREKHNIFSLRQVTNNTVTHNQGHKIEKTWIKSLVNKSKDYRDYKIVSADIKLSNTCNFSCVMCEPTASSRIYSKWKSQQSLFFVQEKLKRNPGYFSDITATFQSQRGYQHLQDIIQSGCMYLKLLGGEPLLDQTLFQILTNVPEDRKKNLSLHFVTNGSYNLIEATQRLSNYKEITFTVSLEGINDMQDYARNGSDWSFIETNILNAINLGIQIKVSHTLQALTILHLDQLMAWCKQHDISLFFTLLTEPLFLGLAVLPDHIKNKVLQKLQTVQNISINDVENTDTNVQLDLRKLLISNCFDSELHKKFMDYIHWYERDSNLKLQNICPEFYQLDR